MKYLDEVKLHIGDVETKSKREIKEICTMWDNEQWKSDINSKSTLKVYRHHKKQIQEEHIYNNHPSSVIWYKARINALQLNDRNRHTNKETRCIICENEIENEDIYHFILYCPAYNTERSQIPELQQPYNNNKEEVLGHFLFDKGNAHKKKEHLYLMWRSRHRHMKKPRKQ